MPSIFTHPAVPLAIATAAGSRKVPLRLFLAGALFAILPDADVLGFGFGIPYEHLLGHRGFFHSPVFALGAALTGAFAYRALRSSYKSIFIILFISMLSHGILDAATSGGLGIAFLSPFSNERFYFPWQPIQVSPISLERFFGSRGLIVVQSELMWVWVPFMLIGIIGVLVRHRAASNQVANQNPNI
ncbi:MAG: metal-dependent hydrolase [Desulfobacteraceae bacterium]